MTRLNSTLRPGASVDSPGAYAILSVLGHNYGLVVSTDEWKVQYWHFPIKKTSLQLLDGS